MAAIAARMPGVVSGMNEVRNDFDIERDGGLALDAAGHAAPIALRSSLGDMALFGNVPSQRMVEDITRTLVRVPGVRLVSSRLRIVPGAPAGAR